jgi:hypothetical protein
MNTKTYPIVRYELSIDRSLLTRMEIDMLVAHELLSNISPSLSLRLKEHSEVLYSFVQMSVDKPE